MSEGAGEKRETVADIVSELRNEPLAENGATPWLHCLAHRIEAAHAREVDARAVVKENYKNELYERIRDENARMRKALKDVLAVHLCDVGTQPISDALCAVAKAKAIMKGEAK